MLEAEANGALVILLGAVLREEKITPAKLRKCLAGQTLADVWSQATDGSTMLRLSNATHEQRIAAAWCCAEAILTLELPEPDHVRAIMARARPHFDRGTFDPASVDELRDLEGDLDRVFARLPFTHPPKRKK